MQRGFQDDVLRTDCVEQLFLSTLFIHTDKFLVESDRQRRVAAKATHFLPLASSYRLLYGVEVETRQLVELAHSVIARKESAVGIDTQFDVGLAIAPTYHPEQMQLVIEVDCTNLKLHTLVSAAQLLLYPCLHLLERAHPDEPVDTDAPFSTGKSRVGQTDGAAVIMPQRRLQSEEHGRQVAQSLVMAQILQREFARSHLSDILIEQSHILSVGQIVAAQFRKRSALAHSHVRCVSLIAESDVPHLALGIDSARGARLLLEMKYVLLNVELRHCEIMRL